MSAPGLLLRPFERLIQISIQGNGFQVPENNTLLRCLQFLAPEGISYGRFCWNEDCHYCRVTYDLGEGTLARAALSCKLMVSEGMRILETTAEIRYCLSKLSLGKAQPSTQ